MFVEGAVRIRSDGVFFCRTLWNHSRWGWGWGCFFGACAAGCRGRDVGLWDADSHGMLEYVACFSACGDDKNCMSCERPCRNGRMVCFRPVRNS